MNTSKIGTYAALPAQWVVNIVFSLKGSDARFRGRHVISEDEDERQKGRNEAFAEMLPFLVYFMFCMSVVIAINSMADPIANRLALMSAPFVLVAEVAALASVLWYNAEAIDETEASAL